MSKRRLILSGNQLRRIVGKLAEEVYVAYPPSVLGRIAFSPQRQQWEEDVPPEDNLPIEDKLLKDLRAYINSPADSLDAEAVSTIRKILDRHEYHDVIEQPPFNDYVYRGMDLDATAMQELCWDAGLDINRLEEGGEYKVRFDFKPRPGKPATSWTTNENIARDFARRPSRDREWNVKWYGVVLEARVGDSPNSFLSLDRLYRLASAANYRHEAEVLGLGQIWVRRIKVVKIEEYKR